jgi:GNAT superfamily N-acetyltransferase
VLRPPFEQVRVRTARREDLGQVLAILSEAAGWLEARSVHQWPLEMPGGLVLPGLEAGQCHLAWDGGAAVGTLTLQDSDERLWGVRPADAFYLHRLAVRRSHRGLGRRLLEWAEAATQRSGRRFLRLDCQSENPAIRLYYEGAGYLRRGEVVTPRWSATLYERDLGEPDR